MSETTTTETTTTAPPPPETVTMPQADLDKLIATRVSAALASERKKGPPTELVTELETLRAEKAERERKKLEEKGEYQKALDAQAKALEEKWKPEIAARDERIQKRETRLHREVVSNRLLSAAADGNAVAPSQVVALLESRVKLDDDFEPQVVDDAGNPRFASDGKPMTPAQLVEEFLRTNPHFVKSSGGKAGGAQGGATTKGAGQTPELQALEAAVAKAEADVMRLGASAVPAHVRAVKALEDAKKG